MTTPRLQALAARLRVTIPAPYKPPPKPRKSFAGLKPGDVVEHKSEGRWVIGECDSEGCELLAPAPEVRPGKRLTERNWKDAFHKVPKRELKKLLATKENS